MSRSRLEVWLEDKLRSRRHREEDAEYQRRVDYERSLPPIVYTEEERRLMGLYATGDVLEGDGGIL